MAITGTSRAHTSPKRWMPPTRTMKTMMAQITPTTMAMIFCWDSVVATTPLMASLMVPAMVLI